MFQKRVEFGAQLLPLHTGPSKSLHATVHRSCTEII